MPQTLRQKVTKAIILAGDKHAFDEGTLLGQAEKIEARLASDPELQRQRVEYAAAANKEMMPALVAGMAFNAVAWGATAWYLPGLVSPTFAACACALTCALLWKIFRA
ncbi:hypothetical protein AB7849_09275 [Rhodanobacter sp. 115]|uniref:hypothetical protein n=1 Tax=Rhodanobacter sp. FW021-MT20 TaxID=1162282 RepID=UPI0034E3E811